MIPISLPADLEQGLRQVANAHQTEFTDLLWQYMIGLYAPAPHNIAWFFELSLDYHCILDPAGRFVRVNRAMTKSAKSPQSDFVAKNLLDFVHPDDHETISINDLRLDGRYRLRDENDVKSIRRPRPDDRYVALKWQTMRDDAGYVYAIARMPDKRTANDMRLDAAVGLNAAMGHDLPGLILPLQLYADIIRRYSDTLSEEALKKQVMRFATGIKRLARETKHIGSYILLSTGSPFSGLEKITLHEFLNTLRESLGERAERLQLEILTGITEFDGDAGYLMPLAQELLSELDATEGDDKIVRVEMQDDFLCLTFKACEFPALLSIDHYGNSPVFEHYKQLRAHGGDISTPVVRRKGDHLYDVSLRIPMPRSPVLQLDSDLAKGLNDLARKTGRSTTEILWGIITEDSDGFLNAMPAPRLNSFFELSDDMLCIISPQTGFVRVNPAMIEKLGYAESEIIGQPLTSFIHPDDQAEQSPMWHELPGAIRSMRRQFRLIHKDGHSIPMDWKEIEGGDALIYAIGIRDNDDARTLELLHNLEHNIKNLVRDIIEDTEIMSPIAQRVEESLAMGDLRAMMEDLEQIETLARRSYDLVQDLRSFIPPDYYA